MTPPPFKARAILLAGLLPLFIAQIAYSVTWSFIWDEGFHIVAAQLIANGKRPYIDFCFPQTPLNAYINAGILLAFGDSWKPVHLVAALYICGAIWLIADFVQSRLPSEHWRTPCALAAGVLFGLNELVVEFGAAAQAYAIGMFLVTAAFRAALPAVKPKRLLFVALAGLCAGGAAASTLLTAPVALVIFVWLIISRVQLYKLALYLVTCAIPFTPVIWLYAVAPKQTVFNVLQYQAIFRRVNWGDVNLRDIDSLTSWLTSPPALILAALVAAAIIFLVRERNQNSRGFWLAAACGLSLVLFISTAHPTFERYFNVSVPFFSMLAGLGLFVAGSRLATPKHAWVACGVVMALTWSMFFRELFDDRDNTHWDDYEEVAQQVAEVTPVNSTLFAEEIVYFLLKRTPPEGMSFSYTEKLDLPAQQEKLFHIVSEKELKKRVQSGEFYTLQTCKDSIVDEYEPSKYFKKHEQPSDCDVFWDPKTPKQR